MKTLIQKIYVEESNSFACRTYSTPNFETNWHNHVECELILITEGHGTALIGDYVGNYSTNDIFFLASDLPHWFRKSHHNIFGAAVVAHFRKDFWGDHFLKLPELKDIQHLLSTNNGILIKKKYRKDLSLLMKDMEKDTGIERIQKLLQCLQLISRSSTHNIITKGVSLNSNSKEDSAIEKIFDYSLNHYLKPITLTQVAGIAEMTIPTFCRFFKKNVKKSYFDFLKELRIGHACKLLQTSDLSILDICYNSGYNSWAHFSKQFKDVKTMTPSKYKKQFET